MTGLRRFGRWLAAAILALIGQARHRRQVEKEEARAQREAAEREARSRRSMARAEAINAEARRAAGDQSRLAELAEELEESHEQVRRRRAEPPPTLEREIVATPRMEGVVLAALALTVLGAAAFIVLYVVYPDTQLFGVAAGAMFIGLSVAAVVAGKRLIPQEKVATEYHWFGDEEAQADVEEVVTEAGEGISRRKLIIGAAGAAGFSVAAAAVVPAASLGPKVDDRIEATPWVRGRRLVGQDGRPLRAADIRQGELYLALPEGTDPRNKFGAGLNVLRFPVEQLELPADRKRAAPAGIVAYSRICTHAGCAVSMYRKALFSDVEPSPALVCPCHYSSFDPRNGAQVVFGPAARPLPQLPLQVNERGELEAAGDFYEPIGPSYGTVRLKGSQE